MSVVATKPDFPAQMADLPLDAAAVGWDVVLHDNLRRSDPALHRDVTDELQLGWRLLVDLSEAVDVLEIGCRWGAATFSIAESLDSPARLVAIDHAPEFASFTSLRARQSGETRVVALCAREAEPLPFASGSFDAVLASRGLDGCGDGRAFLAEVARLLRPGGTLYLGGSGPYGPIALVRRPGLILDALRTLLNSGRGGRTANLWTPDRAKREFEAIGFVDVAVYGIVPDLARPLYLLPLDAPIALDFFLRSVFHAYDWRLRLRKHNLERAFALAQLGVTLLRRLRLTRLAPTFIPAYGIIARKPTAVVTTGVD